MLLFAGCHNSTTLNSLHCSIRSKFEVNLNFADVLLMCAVSILVELPRIAVGSSAGTFSPLAHTSLQYCWTRIQYVALAIILSDSGERMHRDKIAPQRMHTACRIVTRGSCCTKRFADFNGNCESYCSVEKLVASLYAAHMRENLLPVRIIRKQRPPGRLFAVLRGCTWTRNK